METTGGACLLYKSAVGRQEGGFICLSRLTVEVDTRDRERPMAKLEVWVGGKERYRYD
jgi:hypothetical protein